jgi:hypothetical protein
MSQATPFDSILAQCRDLFCDRLDKALAGMAAKADEALTPLISETRDPQMQKVYREARDKALKERQTIQTQFRTRYLREFQERSNRAKKIGDSVSDIDLSQIELELVAEDDLNETLKFNAMAAKVRTYCEEELVALDQRVGVLFGDAALQAEDNPFTPQAICNAYKHTCSQVDSNTAVRMVLLKLFDDYVIDELRGIYKALNALLVQNSILPKIRGVAAAKKDKPSGKTPGATRNTANEAGEREEATGGERDLFSLLQNLVASAPAAGHAPGIGAAGPMAYGMPGQAPAVGAPGPMGFAVMPGAGASAPMAGAGPAQAALAGMPVAAGAPGAVQIVQGADLLRSLTRVQLGDVSQVTGNTVPLATVAVAGEPVTTNVLRDLKATNLGSGMTQMDVMTLDIVALLFDQLFDDPKIPIAVKGLLGRLQIPMLKVAIADKAFFSKKNHPARHMLDTLGEIAARLPPEVNASNDLFRQIEAILQELIERFEDNIEIFNEVRERLTALIGAEDQRAQQETQSAEKEIEQEETLAVAKSVAQAQIKARVRTSKLPPAVLEFLVKQWVKVLILLQVKHGEDSDEWRSGLETMDILIWSVEPKTTLEERRQLVGEVPALLKQLADGLTIGGIEDSVRTAFFADLRKLHSENLISPERARAAAAATTHSGLPGEDPAASAMMPAATGADAASEAGLSAASGALQRDETTVPEQSDAPLEFSLAAEPTSPVPAPEAEIPPPEPLSAPMPAASESDEFVAPLPPPFRLELAPMEDKPPAPKPDPELALEPSAAEVAPVSASETQPGTTPEDALASAASTPQGKPVAAPEEIIAPSPESPNAEAAAPPPAQNPLDEIFTIPPPTPREEPPPEAKRPAAAPRVDPAPVAEMRRDSGKAESSAQKPSAKAADPLDMTAPVTIKNPFGAGEVEVTDLDFTVQLRTPKSADPPAPEVPSAFKLGTWVEITQEGGGTRIAKLTFISPLKTRYLFVDRHGKKSLECSQGVLLRMLRSGDLMITKEPRETPLFDRIADGLLGKLGGGRK